MLEMEYYRYTKKVPRHQSRSDWLICLDTGFPTDNSTSRIISAAANIMVAYIRLLCDTVCIRYFTVSQNAV